MKKILCTILLDGTNLVIKLRLLQSNATFQLVFNSSSRLRPRSPNSTLTLPICLPRNSPSRPRATFHQLQKLQKLQLSTQIKPAPLNEARRI